jgi:hypothetical protein
LNTREAGARAERGPADRLVAVEGQDAALLAALDAALHGGAVLRALHLDP